MWKKYSTARKSNRQTDKMETERVDFVMAGIKVCISVIFMTTLCRWWIDEFSSFDIPHCLFHSFMLFVRRHLFFFSFSFGLILFCFRYCFGNSW